MALTASCGSDGKDAAGPGPSLGSASGSAGSTVTGTPAAPASPGPSLPPCAAPEGLPAAPEYAGLDMAAATQRATAQHDHLVSAGSDGTCSTAILTADRRPDRVRVYTVAGRVAVASRG
jgi:hypothetical protein